MDNHKERIIWIDQLRSFALLIVIIGHVSLPENATSIIYSFHMPLFFIISGLTINRNKLQSISAYNYFILKIQHLIIPYFWMSFLMYPLWYFAFHYLSNGTELTIAQAFLGIFIGNNILIGSPSNALWFVLVLFLANLLFLFLLRISKNNESILLALIVLCAIIGYLDKGKAQIWHFNVTFTAVLFMYIGNCFILWYQNGGKKQLEQLIWPKRCIIYSGLLIIGYISHHMNGRISMTANKFGESLLLFYITSLAFSACIILVFIKLPHLKIISYIGKNTLLYVGIHIPILRIFEKLFPDTLCQYRYSLPFAFFLYFALTLLCALCNIGAPYVCGKKFTLCTRKHTAIKILLIAFGGAIPYMKILKILSLNFLPVSVELLILLGISSIFVLLTERYLPIIYLQEK